MSAEPGDRRAHDPADWTDLPAEELAGQVVVGIFGTLKVPTANGCGVTGSPAS